MRNSQRERIKRITCVVLQTLNWIRPTVNALNAVTMSVDVIVTVTIDVNVIN